MSKYTCLFLSTLMLACQPVFSFATASTASPPSIYPVLSPEEYAAQIQTMTQQTNAKVAQQINTQLAQQPAAPIPNSKTNANNLQKTGLASQPSNSAPAVINSSATADMSTTQPSTQLSTPGTGNTPNTDATNVNANTNVANTNGASTSTSNTQSTQNTNDTSNFTSFNTNNTNNTSRNLENLPAGGASSSGGGWGASIYGK